MIFRTLKAIILWGYARNTWQYDVLCVLILAFIFLTPQRWFNNGELRSPLAHQNSLTETHLLLSKDLISAEMSQKEVEQRVRSLTGRPEAEVIRVSPRRDALGEIVAYEVDIR